MQRKKNALTNILSIFNNALRRFRRKGGLGGALKRTASGLRKGNKKTIATCAVCAAAVIGLGAIIFSSPKDKQQETAQVLAAPAEASVSAVSTQDENGVVSLESEFAAAQAYLAEQEAAQAAANPTPKPIHFEQGYEGEEIYDIQQRLMDLSYMDNDEPTLLFGPQTEYAVELFQRRNNLDITGVITEAVYNLLFSGDALTYMVSLGESGTDVKELQGRLRELDYLDKATGYFGDETEAAVKEFQKNNKLSTDGKVGEKTREMLYSEDAVAKSISYGEKSEDVRSYQKRLYKLGYLVSEPDGTFGRDTVNAVKMFQQQNGLIVDGHIGPMTRDLLMSSDAKESVISVGSNNSTVTKIQSRLRELNYLDSKATGYFGSSTEAAVMGFQKQNKLSADGKVGKSTMKLLFSDSAKKAPSNYEAPEVSVPSGGGSSSSSSGSSSSSSSGGSSGGSLDRFISAAKSKLGCKYVRGAKGPNSFDCSGFVYWCLNQAGVNQKYLTSSGWRSVSGYTKVSSIDSLRKGDIIVFKGHVGIAMGDGTMIDASSGNGKVVHRSCTGKWSYNNFICAWRIF